MHLDARFLTAFVFGAITGWFIALFAMAYQLTSCQRGGKIAYIPLAGERRRRRVR
jgi:hypothetical protein